MTASDAARAPEPACPVVPDGQVRATPRAAGSARPALVPGRSMLTWLLAFGIPRRLLRLAARRGDLIARTVAEPALQEDPFGAYDDIRARGPVVHGRLISATATHSAANQILRGDTFGVAAGHGELRPGIRRVLDMVAEPGALGPLSPPSMLAVDPPEHTRYRRRVSRVFTPRAVAGLEAQVQQVADTLLDRVADVGTSEFDLVAKYASKLPIAVIAGILGVPSHMHDQVLTWGDGVAILLDPGLSWRQYRASAHDLRELSAWFDGHVAHLRRHPGDDLLSRLAQLDGPDRLTDIELRATGLLVLGAGFETTVNLIGNAVALLSAHPEQLAAARADPELWAGVVDEVLRFDSPVQFTLRQAYADTDVDGVAIGAGRGVIVMLGGANRDPEVFTDPHQFNIRRDNAGEHLAFSGGVHFCLGASLARMEATIALRTLYERFPNLSLAGPPTRRGNRVLRGYSHLYVAN